MKSQRLIKKTEKAVLTAYLQDADFTEPPHGFDLKSENSVKAVRLIKWKTHNVINKTFVFKAHVSGYNYVAIACYIKNKELDKLELSSIDALYRNGKW
jgi:hypothetical protein